MSARQTIERLDAISRRRALTLKESLRLERAIKSERAAYRHYEGRWDSEEDRTAKLLRNKGLSYGMISSHVRRSPDAVAARLRYLRERAHA